MPEGFQPQKWLNSSFLKSTSLVQESNSYWRRKQPESETFRRVEKGSEGLFPWQSIFAIKVLAAAKSQVSFKFHFHYLFLVPPLQRQAGTV